VPFDLKQYWKQDPELAAYTGETIWLWRCRVCGFSQPDRIPALPRYFERIYDQHWSPEWIAREFESTYKDVIFHHVLAGLGSRVRHNPKTLLDIGCHVGRFLHLATRAGWHAEGTEINARTATYAAEHSGARVHRVPAEAVTEIGKHFDAVTLTDVLEHIPKPKPVLAAIRRVLAPGGWVAIKVPCGPAQRIKETWRARLVPGYQSRLADNLVHVNHFSPNSLRRALDFAGFEDITISLGAPECPPHSRLSSSFLLAIWNVGRQLPFGVHTPLALHLQAFARRGNCSCSRWDQDTAEADSRM
jgi:SAM-dependent methyltransferase